MSPNVYNLFKTCDILFKENHQTNKNLIFRVLLKLQEDSRTNKHAKANINQLLKTHKKHKILQEINEKASNTNIIHTSFIYYRFHHSFHL